VQTPIKQQHSTEDHDGVDEHPAPAQHLEPIQSVVSASGGPIDETIRIRDLHQFEIKLHYPLSRKRAVETYDLECYIFVPHSLGVHRANYSKARFYDDLQTHIRFKTPSISLMGIAGGQDSPLLKLEASAVPLQEGGRNMVLRYGGDDRVRYKRLRIVLNRRRIKRIETVSVEDG